MTTNSTLYACCGIDCAACRDFPGACPGCGAVQGRPGWIAEVPGAGCCPLYACCTGQKGLTHCGQCAELPCRLFSEFCDPSLPKEAALAELQARLDLLRTRTD